MKVGKISYLNTAPFFYRWENRDIPFEEGVPRELAGRARAGSIVAAALPVVECWALEDKFVPLGNWGIAVRKECKSVLVLSKRPFPELDGMELAVTEDSSTSVRLCEVLIRTKYRHSVHLRRGFRDEDEARLVIGDEALQLGYKRDLKMWPFLTDLAQEWWEWKGLPFVFARWVVQKDLSVLSIAKIFSQIKRSLRLGMRSYPEIAEKNATLLGVPDVYLIEYLKSFTYELGAEEMESIDLFKNLVAKLEKIPAVV
ncbi:MAG: menaquinone biosynthesis protein [Elusimicrobia bacterium]|nr:menaquinone biosynthesis protein [Candidatus Obscuribacterium magneticum]